MEKIKRGSCYSIVHIIRWLLHRWGWSSSKLPAGSNSNFMLELTRMMIELIVPSILKSRVWHKAFSQKTKSVIHGSKLFVVLCFFNQNREMMEEKASLNGSQWWDSGNRILDKNYIGKEVYVNLNPVVNKMMMSFVASSGPSTVFLHWRSRSKPHHHRSLDLHSFMILIEQRKGVLSFLKKTKREVSTSHTGGGEGAAQIFFRKS